MPKKTVNSEEETKKKVKKGSRKALKRMQYEAKGRKLKLEKAKAKRDRQSAARRDRETLGEEECPKAKPHTLESMREYDVTTVADDDAEVAHDEEHDEMASYFRSETTPKVLITMAEHARLNTWKLCYELRKCIPNSAVLGRKHRPLKDIIRRAVAKEFTDLIVINDDNSQPNGLMLCHLPHGPTAYFKINTMKYSKDLKRHGESTSHEPEVILNNFNTRLGHTVARMLSCLFPQRPNFKGRRVVTFHNQRDYIFFRHHRYEFKNEGEMAALLELGPRFTLRLKWLQKGTFDSEGEYEWVLKRHEMETSRRRFFL